MLFLVGKYLFFPMAYKALDVKISCICMGRSSPGHARAVRSQSLGPGRPRLGSTWSPPPLELLTSFNKSNSRLAYLRCTCLEKRLTLPKKYFLKLPATRAVCFISLPFLSFIPFTLTYFSRKSRGIFSFFRDRDLLCNLD